MNEIPQKQGLIAFLQEVRDFEDAGGNPLADRVDQWISALSADEEKSDFGVHFTAHNQLKNPDEQPLESFFAQYWAWIEQQRRGLMALPADAEAALREVCMKVATATAEEMIRAIESCVESTDLKTIVNSVLREGKS